ncbi:MAG: adenylate cyclase [Solirubrobacteraceae bacterium]
MILRLPPDASIVVVMDWDALGLLEGLEGEDREVRQRLLERLHSGGATKEQLRAATENGTLVFLGADRQLEDTQLYSLEELAEETGLDMNFLTATVRASGLAVPAPGDRTLSSVDAELLRIGAGYRALGLTDEDMLEVTRVLARGLAPVAETMRGLALKLALRPGSSEEDLAVDFAQVVEQLMPSVGPLITGMMRVQLHNIVISEAVNAAERAAGALPGARDVAVCFADIVGFTRMGEDVQADELGQIATRLEQLAAQAVCHPVRIVKSIGDAVMLVSPEVAPMVDSALALSEAAEADESIPQLRAGIAAGPAFRRASDWFGQPVNLASRITAVARPASVLVSADVQKALADNDTFKLSYAGARRLKGIREPVPLHRVRRAA